MEGAALPEPAGRVALVTGAATGIGLGGLGFVLCVVGGLAATAGLLLAR